MSDIISNVIAGFSLLLVIINLIWSWFIQRKQRELNKRALEISEEQLKVSQGQIELEMANQLSTPKKYVDSWDALVFERETDESKKDEILKRKKAFVIEEALNCYEVLCQKYLDSKVDKDKFDKSYRREISNLR